MDYIEAHLDGDLSLAALARVVNFSEFHFHRVFKGVVGETLNQFIQRRRVEKAARFLTGNPAKSVTEIALDCGFSGSAAFARAFKDAFGVSASQYRKGGGAVQSKVGKNIIPAGKYAIGRFELSSHEFEEAWTGVMGGWLPQSGYQCDDRPCAEIYQNDPKEHPEGK
jgi:AraC family transcriptional regulator